MAQFATVDEYLAAQTEVAQAALRKVRETIHASAPGVDERISYQIPTFSLDGKDLLFIAAWKRFLSIYPVGEVGESLEREISPYRAAKATLRFPLAKPIPLETIAKVVRHRAKKESRSR